jgi:hypothetical protein
MQTELAELVVLGSNPAELGQPERTLAPSETMNQLQMK